MILVTGATGNVGTELIKKLSAGGHSIRAFVRSRAQAQAIALPRVQFVEGDFAKPETFAPALADIDRLFLLIPSSSDVERQQRDFVEAAKQSKVRHIVKLSQLGADEHAAGRFQHYHGAVEEYIRHLDISYTFLRPICSCRGCSISGRRLRLTESSAHPRQRPKSASLMCAISRRWLRRF